MGSLLNTRVGKGTLNAWKAPENKAQSKLIGRVSEFNREKDKENTLNNQKTSEDGKGSVKEETQTKSTQKLKRKRKLVLHLNSKMMHEALLN